MLPRLPARWLIVAALAATFTSIHPAVVPAQAAAARIHYLSPSRDARLVRPETGILLRADRGFDSAILADASAIQVTGSISGVIDGRVHLADGGRVLIFQPDRSFLAGERVEVSVRLPGSMEAGVLGNESRWSFTIASVQAPPYVARLEIPDEPVHRVDSAPGEPFWSRWAPADTLPATFPDIDLRAYAAPAKGRLFISTFPPNPADGTPFLLILDDNGAPIFYREMDGLCFDFKAQPDGRLTYYYSPRQKYYAMDSTYTVVDSFACGNGYTTDLHEMRTLPNGHVLLMSYDPQVVDMSQVVPGGNPAATVIGLIIQELDENKDVVFQWRSWDHFAITDAIGVDLTAAQIDYSHGNAIEQDIDGNILISSRHMSEITKIDRQTGEIVWRLGGKHNQFTLVDDAVWFSYQHAIRRIANGHITLFDNGNQNPGQYSRAVEYELDEQAKRLRHVWEYRNSPDTYGFAMGYVQRLDNGSTLVSWGTGKPDVIEVRSDGTKVLQLTLPAGVYSYRVLRQEWMPNAAPVVPIAPTSVSLSANSPNPFSGQTRMRLALPYPDDVSAQMYDVRGRAVPADVLLEPFGAGVYRLRISMSGQPNGVYFCRVTTSRESFLRRMVHLE